MSVASKEIPSTLDYTVLALRQLAAELPMNDFGLPTGIYRTDLLPFHEYIPPGSSTNIAEPQDDVVIVEPEIVDPIVEVEQPVIEVDPYALMAGAGDGLPDMLLPARTPAQSTPNTLPTEYRIAGFPAASLHNAFVPLQYDEGFPAFEDGRPFWGRLEFEPTDAYLIFQRYLQMSFGRTADPEDEEDYGLAAQGTRSIDQLILQTSPGIDDKALIRLTEKFKEYYHLYYWNLRTKSYDLFRVTEFRQKQELRAIETQDDHYVQARKLRKRLMVYMDNTEDFWDMMTPKTGIDMFKTLTQLERISAGVPSGGPMTKGEEQGGRSFEMAFRTVAQLQHGDSVGEGTVIDQEGSILDKALEDPVATKLLQEIIIKSGGG